MLSGQFLILLFFYEENSKHLKHKIKASQVTFIKTNEPKKTQIKASK